MKARERERGKQRSGVKGKRENENTKERKKARYR